VAATRGVDSGTWARARGWAAAMAATLLLASDDDPSYERLARETITELAQSPA
jgi:rhamnogalacturonyl hydrolase YesR